MKASELMSGDWVIRKGIPSEHMQIAGFNEFKNLVYMDFQGRGITENLDGIEPIPITTEFLERNGFIDPSYSKKVKYELHEPDLQITYYPRYSVMSIWKKGENPVIVRQNGFYKAYNEVVQYIHEFQHALKDCKIERNVVV